MRGSSAAGGSQNNGLHADRKFINQLTGERLGPVREDFR